MNWFTSLSKISALEAMWWHRFFFHLTGAANYVFPDHGVSRDPSDFLCRLESNNFSSGIDGDHIFFSLKVWRKGHQYTGSINLLFSQTLIRSKMKWEHSNLQSLEADPSIHLIRANWSVLRDFNDPQNSGCVGNGILAPEQATPVRLMEIVKDCIVRDGEDDDDSEGFYNRPPQPSSKKKQPVSKPPRVLVGQ